MRSPYLDSDRVYPPLGILYLKSCLNKCGIRVGLEDEFDFTSPEKYVEYDSFGASVMTPQREASLAFLQFCKVYYPGKPVVIGGPHAKHYLEDVKKEAWDYIVPHDGQRALLNIMGGTAPRVVFDFIQKQDWANIDVPDRTSKEAIEMLSRYNYTLGGRKSTTMLTALGCPERCRFCFTPDTRILTPQGYVKIKDIKKGNSVITFNESTGAVEVGVVRKLFKRRVQQYLRIRTQYGKILRVTEEHPFYINGAWIKAKDLKVGNILHTIDIYDRMKYANPSFNAAVKEKGTVKYRALIRDGKLVPYLSTREGRRMVSKRQSVIAREDNAMHRPGVSERNHSKENYNKRRAGGFGIVKSRPNRIEKELHTLLTREFKGQFQFVGNGGRFIAGYVPDFVHKKEKKLIEINGCYWHRCEGCAYLNKDKRTRHIKRRDSKKLRAYKAAGYEVLVVKEHELTDKQQLKKKIFNFLSNGVRILSIKPVQKDTDVHNFECTNNTYFAEGVLVHNCEDAQTAVRWSSMENINQQLDDIVALGYKGIYVFDDLFAISLKMIKPICAELKKRDIIYRCNGQARYFNEEFAKTLADTGCYEIAFGAETGSQKLLDAIDKRTTVEQNYKFVELCKKYGIICKTFLMLGLPGETYETIAETEAFIKEAKPDDFQLSIYYPYKGTKLRDAIDKGTDNFDLQFEGEGLGAYGQGGGSTESVVRTQALTSQELLTERDRLVRLYRPESHINKWETQPGTDHFFDTHLKSKTEYVKE